MGFDSVGRLSNVTYAYWNGQPMGGNYMAAMAYTPTGLPTSSVYGNGIQMSSSYDGDHNITGLSYVKNSQILWGKQFSWQTNARIPIFMADTLNSGMSEGFGNYPTDAIFQWGQNSGQVSQYTQVDAWGNLTQTGSYSFQPAAFNSNNQIALTGFSYDAAGNLTNEN